MVNHYQIALQRFVQTDIFLTDPSQHFDLFSYLTRQKNAIYTMHNASALCQSGKSQNVFFKRSQDKDELAGRMAGSG